MIYLVSNTIDVTDLPEVQKLTVENSIALIKSWPVVQFDTETTGLDPHVCKLTSLQFGYKDYQTDQITTIVIDCNSIKPEQYKEILECSYLIGHNLKFDLQFLFNHGIAPLNVYDTMICEQLLYLGYSHQQVSFGLHDVLLRNVGIELDKSYQSQIATKGLSKEGIIYSAHDVMYLQDIRKAQLMIAESRKCVRALTVENRFVPAIAYLEWCGIRMDIPKWTAKMIQDKKELDDYENKLNAFVKSNPVLKSKFVADFAQPSLFEVETTSEPKVTVQWNSSQQVVPVFQALGFNTKTFDKKKKQEKDSVLEKLLSSQKGINDTFLELYFGFKGAEKNVSSYGQGHLNLINPRTGRLHTVFTQLGTVTGRMSSGSKKKNADLARLKGLFPNDVRFVNLQNLPARAEAGKICRSCFIPEEGNSFISCDFSAEESRVQADVWDEAVLLDAFEHGLDTHSLYAKLCFPKELDGIDIKDVKKLRPDLRQTAKGVEFAIGYGSDGSAIAENIGMSIDKAKELVQEMLKKMPGMAKFKKKTINFLKKNGYIIINETTGHRVYWPEWSQWRSVEDRFDRDFWNDYNINHKGTGDEVCKMVKEHMAMSQDWFNKNVLNYPIQGGSAVVLKQAGADLFEWIVKHKLFNTVKFCVMAHDEIDIECPKKYESQMAKVLENIMEQAAAKFYKKLKIPAECSCGDHWIH